MVRTQTRRAPVALIALLAAFALVAAACSDDAETSTESESTSTSASASEPASDSASASEPASGSASASEPASDSASSSDSASASEPAEPATVIAHTFGETIIEGTPERVMTLGYSEQDPVLALGVSPIAVREWFGEFAYATWPWAEDELGDGEPAVLNMPYGELNYEEIAALAPDVIIATHGGITQEEYDTLSEIAPTIPEAEGALAFSMSWQEQTQMIGDALGLSDEAEQRIRLTQAAVLDAARANDDFGGRTLAWLNAYEGGEYWVVGDTPPMAFFADLGFTSDEALADAVGELDSLQISLEQINLLDVDTLLIASSPTTRDEIEADPLWQSLSVFQEDRVVWIQQRSELYGALSFSTILSVDFLVDELVPLLAGGDTADTEVALSPEAEAAMAAFALVYDSNAAWEDKAPHLENAASLEASNAAYQAGGDGMGGISLDPTSATIDGDMATVIYDVYFGDSAAYTGLDRTITLIDGVWVVAEADYCDFLASARTPCSG
ncbi:MAG: iron-siderophore ABC transporter substrate-binding protein [Actinomycetota bacterium]